MISGSKTDQPNSVEGAVPGDASPRATRFVQAAVPRICVAFALFLLNAIVTLPWAIDNWGISLLGILILAGWLAVAAVAVPIARDHLNGPAYWLSLIAALFLSRMAALFLVQGGTIVGDPEIYQILARSLLSGEGLIFHDPLTEVDFRALYPPVYPLFLAGLGLLFGLGEPAIWAGNVAIDLASAFILVGLGARCGSPAAGRAAAWLFAIWPAFIFASPFAQKEGLVTLQVLTVALILLRLDRARIPRWWESGLIGGVAASLMLTQPGLALLPAILALVLLPAIGSRPLCILLLRASPVALLLLAPWWIRNFHVLGSFVPLTTTGGLGLWVGNNPNATGNWLPMPPEYRGIPEIMMSARVAHEALGWIWNHPLDFVSLTFFKLFHAMGIEQFTLGRFGLMTPKPSAATLAALFPLLQGSLITILAGMACIAQRVRFLARGDRLVLIMCGCAIQILIFSLPFEFGERHRFFLMPFLFLVVAAGLIRHQAASRRPFVWWRLSSPAFPN